MEHLVKLFSNYLTNYNLLFRNSILKAVIVQFTLIYP